MRNAAAGCGLGIPARGAGGVRAILDPLRRALNLPERDTQQHRTQRVEAQAERPWIARVAADDAARCPGGREHERCLQGMVDPLPEADEEQAEGQEECVGVGDALQRHGGRAQYADGAKDDEHVIPRLDLQPGECVVLFQVKPPMRAALERIGWYAQSHGLTPEEVLRAFCAGVRR